MKYPYENTGEGLIAAADKTLRYAAAHSVTAVIFLLGVAPMPLKTLGLLHPPVILIPLFFWALYRPAFMPPTLIFLLGLFQDILAGTPLGLNALIYVGLHWFVLSQRTFLLSQGFFLTWWGFALSAFGATLLYWGLFCLLNLALFPIVPALLGTLVCACLFPLIVLPLTLMHRLLSAHH